ncbi:hypothetical protein [Marasmitruncus massiliensis]|uniref:hypothetical protein n=1 Tax=Marasmitruncus massiliensis TaxID=1944642 RepID=UPI000C7DA5DB|nr:hypothetical protein [Marasmitruncus massiliensis]
MDDLETKSQQMPDDSFPVSELLRRIEENTAEQKRSARKQLLWVQFCAVMAAVLTLATFAAGAVLLPRIYATLTRADSVLQNLETVTDDLADGDLFKNMDLFMAEGGSAVTETLEEAKSALEALKSVDIAGLNKAIQDLQAVVEPLARLFR